MAALSALALITAFGCSDDSDLFAGMWDFNEEIPFHTATAEGILSIEGPCVYVIDDYAWLFPGTPLEELPDPIHIFVNMPRGQFKHDPDNQLIWVHDEGPMASGDRIEMIGGGVDPGLPDICSTDSDRAFNVKTMAPKLCVPWLLPDHPSQTGCKPVPLDPFAGMWYYDEKVPFHQAEAEGILLIKEPCVYIIRDFGSLFPSTPLEELPDPVRVFVKLPRDQTRYDPDAKSIWVHDDGPMASGDRVKIGGGGFAQVLPDACSADVGNIFTATSMQPKRCDPRWPPNHPSQTGCKPADSLAGMWDYNPALPSYAPAAEGVLLIEGPCVYVIDDFMWLVPGVPLEELPEPVRVFVNLPRAQTSYDPNTDTIQVHDQGPMASGDRVQMAGGADRSVPDACSAGVDRAFTATHMSPKQCLPWMPPERQTGCKPTETP